MKKKVIDEINNINDELVEKVIEIDSQEKLAIAKQGEKNMERGKLFTILAISFACICLVFIGISFTKNASLSNNTSTNVNTNNVYVPDEDEPEEPVEPEDDGKDKYRHNEFQKDVVIEPYPLLSSVKIKSNGLEDFDLYFIKLNNDEENIVYSPLSIKYALEMLSEGAKGQTKTQIDAILGSYRAGKYYNSKNVSFANAIFINDQRKDSINQNYIDRLNSKFNASLTYDSFKSAYNVNSWISEKTLNMINNLLQDDYVKDRFFVIINALAIDMEWINRIQPHESDIDDGNYMPGYEVRFNHESPEAQLYISAYDSSASMEFNGDEAHAMSFGSAFNNYNIVKVLGESKIRDTVKKAYQDWYNDPEVQSWLNSLDEEERKMYVAQDLDKLLDSYVKELNSNYHKFGNSTDYRFYVDDNVKVFAKDLKRYNGTQFEYIQIMPTKVNLKDYINNMKSSEINKLINKLIEPTTSAFKEGTVTLIEGSLPAFKFEYNMNLISNLNKLGIYDVFVQDKADLSGITNEDIYVDSMIHSATIEFSNDGIKAAAVTAVGGAGDDGMPFHYEFDVPVEIIDLTFDKPFIYLIREKTTGEIWFTGAVYHPVVDDIDWDSIEW